MSRTLLCECLGTGQNSIIIPGIYIWLRASHLIVQLLSCVRLLAIPWSAAHQVSLSFSISWSLLKLMTFESVMLHPSPPLVPPSPLALNPSQSQCLFQWVGSSHQEAKSTGASASVLVLPMSIQGWFPLGFTGLILQSKGLSRVFSNTTIQKHQSALTLLYSPTHIHTWLLKKP